MMVGTGEVMSYSRLLPLSLRREGQIQGQGQGHGQGPDTSTTESREVTRVTVTYPSSTTIPNAHKEIKLRLTKDDDPGFFYHLRIAEGDFPALRAELKLLVDFAGFPNFLLALLQKCEGRNDTEASSQGPSFLLVMKTRGAQSVLDIVQSDPFVYLSHLSLAIVPGSDAEVRLYLCELATALKKDNSHLNDKLSNITTALTQETERLKNLLELKEAEITRVREEAHQVTASLSSKHWTDLSAEKEKVLMTQATLASKFEEERKDIERKHSLHVSSLESRLASLESETRELLEGKYKAETAFSETSTRLRGTQEDLRLLQGEISVLRKQNERLDTDYHDRQRLNHNLQQRLATMEAELREKGAALEGNSEEVMALRDVKKNLEDHARALVTEVERVKGVNKTVSSELIKANEIIKKLQDDVRTYSSKSKLQGQVAEEQERIIGEKESQIVELEGKITSLELSLVTANSDRETLQESLNAAEEKIVDLEKTICSNENMISWLNKQLNEFQGLSNLSKFRQNLASSTTGTVTGTTATGLVSGISPIVAGSNCQNNTNASGRRLLTSANTNCGMGMGSTPPWLQAYQSSTPQEEEKRKERDEESALAARLQRVAANPTFGMSYAELKSRFSDPYEEKENEEKEKSAGSASASAPPLAKPPTWARGRGGKVTLEINKPLSRR